MPGFLSLTSSLWILPSSTCGVKPSTYWLCSSCATRVNVLVNSSVFFSRKNPPPVSSESRFNPRSGLERDATRAVEVLVLESDRVDHHIFDASAIRHIT